MFKVNGNNVFKDNRFDWNTWSADVYQTPDEVNQAFNSFNLLGKRLIAIRAIGIAYSYDEDALDSCVYMRASRMTDEERNGVDVGDWYDGGMLMERFAEVDEPFILTFEGGDRLEIDFSTASCVRMSKNCLPEDIKFGTNPNNFDANKLFSCFIGQPLERLELITRNDYPGFIRSHGLELDEFDEYVDSLRLVFANGKKFHFEAWTDLGHVWALNRDDEVLQISLDELKALLIDY